MLRSRIFGLRCRPASLCLTSFALALTLPSIAQAHVKWFQPYNIADTPISPSHFMEMWPWLLGLFLSIPAVWACIAIDRLSELRRPAGVLRAVIARIDLPADTIMRLVVGVWLSWLWLLPSPIWLTPELVAHNPAVQWLQLGLAGFCLFSRMSWVTGIGLLGLWIAATGQYGLYHLMDYPLFMGVAAYLIGISAAHSSQPVAQWLAAQRLNMLVGAMAVTLMWASIEKWAFANWSIPLLHEYPHLTMGMTPEMFLAFAGWLEFGAAVMLVLGGKVSSRLSAFVLLFIFTAAVLDFGRTDLVGHFPIICALMVVIAKGNGRLGDILSLSHRPVLERALRIPIRYGGALFVTMIAYLGFWNLFYGTGLETVMANQFSVATWLLVAVVTLWICSMLASRMTPTTQPIGQRALIGNR
ncbi:hypothetical protein G6L37_17130 [Agrobacterium rubi]|uniref:hypothetical protein n=1 Tax=Agrobacterium rubi TaxID=28099 RepID=UPI00157195A2|nr:hypothetical protein [Agrobacterium rubi]NTF07876.1 hypothetical protein [Agrobacterium rubi]NTF20120.1 hypothetical protein [Agrobacterium rubi]NTF27091.1 hypothetical protein [Agrobacterium rubi]